jgi:hypothetical protein
MRETIRAIVGKFQTLAVYSVNLTITILNHKVERDFVTAGSENGAEIATGNAGFTGTRTRYRKKRIGCDD